MPVTFNPFTDNLDFTGSSSGTIPEYMVDPSSPAANQVWVLRLQSIQTSIFPLGMVLTGGSSAYKLSYRTTEGTTKRVVLS